MMEIIGECIICDRDTARKLWNEEPEKRPFIYLEEEYRATVPLTTDDILKIEELKKNPKGFVYKKGMKL